MAIRAEPRIFLTKEAILSRVSQYDILRAFWPSGRKLELNRSILSPFRGEKDESFIIGVRNGSIVYKDMGNYKYRGDIWNFVQQIEGLADLNSVLLVIDQRLQLDIGKGEPVKKSPIVQWEQPKIEIVPPPKFLVIPREYNHDELAYWNLYFQDRSDLIRENILVPKGLYRNGRRVPLPKGDLVFCYYYPEIDCYKIYRPLRAKKGKGLMVHERKWDTNAPFDYVEGLDKINGCKVAFLNKAKKDKMVLMKALETDCIATVHGEDPSCLNDKTLAHIKANSHIQVCTSDNDAKGKEFSWWLTNNHGYLHCNVPDQYNSLGMTDFADWAREAKSLKPVTEHFKNKGFI